MRFRNKVLFVNIAFISLALGILGFIMIYRNYKQTIDIQTNYAIEESNLIQASIEYQLLDSLNNKSNDITSSLLNAGEETASQLLSGTTKLAIIYGEDIIYSNTDEKYIFPMNVLSNSELGSKTYITKKESSNYIQYVISHNEINGISLYIVTISDVTKTYSVLYSQISFFVIIIVFVLIVCGIFLYIISAQLTKPLEQLNEVTETIINGDYSIHANVNTDDEIGELAKKFNDMTIAISEHIDELNLMVKQREQFVADFTHEIKTPMTAIIGYADTLRKRPLPPDSQKLAYDYIYSEGKRLESMSMKLFDLIYLRENELILSELDTKVLAIEVENSVLPLLNKKNIQLKTSVESSIIFAEPELLKIVFINIIDNARKASDGNSTIEFKGYTKDNSYVYEVTDHGCGMTEEAIQNICNEFYMVDKSRSRAEGGAGLGMSLVAIIVERHHATLDIKSKVNEGTTMIITLPKMCSV